MIDCGDLQVKWPNRPRAVACRRPNKGLVIITNKQDVDVASDAGPIVQHLLHATQQHAEDGLLDVLVAVDAGGQGTSQLIKDVLQDGSKGGRQHYFSASEDDKQEGKQRQPDKHWESDLGSARAEVANLGDVVRWQVGRHFLAHLFDRAGDHDGPGGEERTGFFLFGTSTT